MKVMIFRIGIENNNEGRSIVWFFDHPGCFNYGNNSSEALAAAQYAITRYSRWIENNYSGGNWIDLQDPQIIHTETWECYKIDKNYQIVQENGYDVDAWFQDDWKPLSETEVERGILLLSWTRKDLLETIHGLDRETMSKKYEGQRWDISGILKHITRAEQWYLDRIGVQVPDNGLEHNQLKFLSATREILLQTLPTLTGKKLVVGVDGEFWSPRKLLRRALWHERDHTFHIQALIDQANDLKIN